MARHQHEARHQREARHRQAARLLQAALLPQAALLLPGVAAVGALQEPARPQRVLHRQPVARLQPQAALLLPEVAAAVGVVARALQQRAVRLLTPPQVVVVVVVEPQLPQQVPLLRLQRRQLLRPRDGAQRHRPLPFWPTRTSRSTLVPERTCCRSASQATSELPTARRP